MSPTLAADVASGVHSNWGLLCQTRWEGPALGPDGPQRGEQPPRRRAPSPRRPRPQPPPRADLRAGGQGSTQWGGSAWRSREPRSLALRFGKSPHPPVWHPVGAHPAPAELREEPDTRLAPPGSPTPTPSPRRQGQTQNEFLTRGLRRARLPSRVALSYGPNQPAGRGPRATVLAAGALGWPGAGRG